MTVYHGGFVPVPIPEIRIGRNTRLILGVAREKNIDVIDALIKVYNSFVSEKIDDYNSSFYYENPSYILTCYLENKVL